MPAPRTCRSCGAALSTRRCPGCGAEATEFAARPPLHGVGFVAAPSHPVTTRGHYSRWETSPTTFGPVIKVGVTVFLLGMLALGLFLVFFILWFVQLFLTGWMLKELWRPAWIAPPNPDRHTPPSVVTVEPLREGFRVPPPPESSEPIPDRPRTGSEITGLVLLVFGGVALAAVFAFGTDEMRLGAIMLATLLGMCTFFRSFLV